MTLILRLDDTSLANEALALAEQSQIGSLVNDTGKKAETCRTFFASLRQSLQTGYKWNCTDRWLEASEAADAPPNPDFAHAYRLGADALRVVEVRKAGRDFCKSGSYVYCNIPDKVFIRVVRLEVDPSLWDETLRSVFVAMLAVKIAPRLGTSEGRIRELKDDAGLLSRKMKRIDADENGQEEAPSGTWLSARRGGC